MIIALTFFYIKNIVYIDYNNLEFRKVIESPKQVYFHYAYCIFVYLFCSIAFIRLYLKTEAFYAFLSVFIWSLFLIIPYFYIQSLI